MMSVLHRLDLSFTSHPTLTADQLWASTGPALASSESRGVLSRGVQCWSSAGPVQIWSLDQSWTPKVVQCWTPEAIQGWSRAFLPASRGKTGVIQDWSRALCWRPEANQGFSRAGPEAIQGYSRTGPEAIQGYSKAGPESFAGVQRRTRAYPRLPYSPQLSSETHEIARTQSPSLKNYALESRQSERPAKSTFR